MNGAPASPDQNCPCRSMTGLRVLQVEDSESDAALMARLLTKAGREVHTFRVEDATGLRAALEAQPWDVILADYCLPQFSAPDALAILHEMGLDIPFIVISGVIGEETAVELMKSGAHDCMLKGNLARLVPAVEREIREAAAREERRQHERTRIRLVQELEARTQVQQDTLLKLEAALNEKTVLMKEIHHRIKNNLAVISSLLGMKADLTEIPEARLALEDSQQRVRSIALVHELLYATDHLDRVNFNAFVEQLVHEITAVFVADAGRISIHVAVEPIEVATHQAIPCALILNELITNAFKYAFPGRRDGHLQISFRQADPEHLELAIEDNGVGCPAHLTNGNGKSMGLRVVRILTKQLDGSLQLEACAGTRFVLRFPMERSKGIASHAAA